jgi:hypothetical protein
MQQQLRLSSQMQATTMASGSRRKCKMGCRSTRIRLGRKTQPWAKKACAWTWVVMQLQQSRPLLLHLTPSFTSCHPTTHDMVPHSAFSPLT